MPFKTGADRKICASSGDTSLPLLLFYNKTRHQAIIIQKILAADLFLRSAVFLARLIRSLHRHGIFPLCPPLSHRTHNQHHSHSYHAQ